MTRSPADLRVEVLDAAAALIARAGRFAELPVEGQSMQPTLRAGFRIQVDCAPGSARVGDLLVFRQSDSLVIHRIVGRAGAGWRTRGDGKIQLDAPVPPGRVLGRVVAFSDGEIWWDLGGAAARFYARGVAWHDLFWARAGSLALRCDRLVGSDRLHRWTRGLDAWLLGRVHAGLFRRLHRRGKSGPGD